MLIIVVNKEAIYSILMVLDKKIFEEVTRAVMPQVYALRPYGSFIERTFQILVRSKVITE